MPGGESALIHVAQVVRSERTGGRSAVRNAQGEFEELPSSGQTDEGVTFPARLMYFSGQRTRPEPESQGTAQEIVRRFEFLAADTDDAGNPLLIEASDQLQFLDAGPLGTPTVEVSGQPELLNDGVESILWWGEATLVEDVGNQ